MKNSKTQIVFLEIKESWERDYLSERLEGKADMHFFSKTAQEASRDLADADIVSIFVKSKIDRQLLNKLPRLKYITTRSTGFDHIDVKAAGEKQIQVSNVPIYGENTVAEHAFALILALARNLKKTYLRTLKGDFSSHDLMGFDLQGKTLGVVGTGHIGLHMIRIAVGFGMKVIAFDAHENKEFCESFNFEYVAFEDLLHCSDVISFHLPLLPSTRHLINPKTIRLIKKGAILINTARGGLIDTTALVNALDDGTLAGAGLDVLEDEEYLIEEKRLLSGPENEEHWKKIQNTLENHILLHRENVIYTPHIAFYSKEAVQRILDTTIQNISSFLDQNLTNQVI